MEKMGRIESRNLPTKREELGPWVLVEELEDQFGEPMPPRVKKALPSLIMEIKDEERVPKRTVARLFNETNGSNGNGNDGVVVFDSAEKVKAEPNAPWSRRNNGGPQKSRRGYRRYSGQKKQNNRL